MLDLDYYDRLKNAAVVPDKLEEFFEDESQSYFCYETLLPSIRVLLYAASNEKYLFSVLYEKITKAENLPPFFYERLKPDDLFNCLGLLGDDCLFGLLSKLDCSDSTLIQLHQTVIDRDLVGFRAVLEQGNINTATITPICKLLYIRIRIDTGIEWLIENSQYIDEITDKEQIQSELKKLVRCLNSSAQGFLNEVFNNEKEVMSALTSSTDKMTSVINNAMTSDGFEADCSLEIDDFLIEGVVMGLKALEQDVQKEDFSKQEWLENIFRMVLWCYYTMKKESIVSLTALDVLREVVFIPRYEGVWEKYENSNGLELLDQDLDIFWGDGIVEDTQPTPQIEEPAAEEEKDTPVPRKTAQETEDDSKTQDFRDAAPKDKADELYSVIEELLNEIEGREHEFFGDNYDLNDLKAIFESILKYDAGESINTQRAVIDELSATNHERVSRQSRYYHKERLWLLPFFIILGHLYNKGVWNGDQLSFVKALFPDKHDKSPIYGVPYKSDEQFINTCRAKISLGNTTLFKKTEDSKKLDMKWKTWFEWIDTLL